MSPPRNTTVAEGSRVRLSCHADGYPGNITYRWSRDGIDIHLLARNMWQVRGQVLDDGSLLIDRVHREDTGWYKCQPSNGVGSLQAPEAQAFLNVTC